MKISETDRKRRSEQIKQQTVNIYLDDSLSGIKRKGKDPEDIRKPLDIRSHLHLIVLSSDRKRGKYDYAYLTTKLGKLKVDNTFIPERRQPQYGMQLMKNFGNGIAVNVFVNPLDPFLPPCYMEIHLKNNPKIERVKNFLIDLADKFPALNVSKIEYANDIYCLNSKTAREVYEVIRRHLYVPYQRTIRDYGEQIGVKYGKMNRVYRIGDTKMYERGKDSKKCGEGWPDECLDRIRLEHTACRRQLKNHDICTIGDLIKNPKFFELNKKVYGFKNYKKSDKLPRFYDSFNSAPNNIDSFQAEHLFHKKHIKNIGQYVEDTPNFKKLKSTLFDCWSYFDKTWAET